MHIFASRLVDEAKKLRQGMLKRVVCRSVGPKEVSRRAGCLRHKEARKPHETSTSPTTSLPTQKKMKVHQRWAACSRFEGRHRARHRARLTGSRITWLASTRRAMEEMSGMDCTDGGAASQGVRLWRQQVSKVCSLPECRAFGSFCSSSTSDMKRNLQDEADC